MMTHVDLPSKYLIFHNVATTFSVTSTPETNRVGSTYAYPPVFTFWNIHHISVPSPYWIGICYHCIVRGGVYKLVISLVFR